MGISYTQLNKSVGIIVYSHSNKVLCLMNTRKVNLFIIGQPKAGTTAIYDYMALHPQIFVPKQKQLYHFATDHNKERASKNKYNKGYYRNYFNYSFNSYLKHFNFNKTFLYYTDITPDYFYSQDAARNIFNYNPKAKVILLLREPLSFLKSFHNQLINSGCEFEKDFYTALLLEKVRKQNNIVFNSSCPQLYYYYSELINYLRFIRPYYDLFNNNFKIIIYEDFKTNNHVWLEKLFTYLNISNIEYNSIIKSNISKISTPPLIQKVKASYPIRILSSVMPNGIKRYLKNYRDKVSRDSQNIFTENVIRDTVFRKELITEIEKLSKFINEKKLIIDNESVDLIKKWKYEFFE